MVGACAEPSELIGGQLRPSKNWGKSASETAKALSEFGRVLAIGVAGENRVRFATLSADGRHAGRGGLGAVMGSKLLKAIAIQGDVETPIADPARVSLLGKRLRERASGESTAKYRELGTIGNLLSFDRLGTLPTRNFQQSHFDLAENLSAEHWHKTRAHRRTSCASCTIGCEHRFSFDVSSEPEPEPEPGLESKSIVRSGGEGEATRRSESGGSGSGSGETRVEYESLFALGPLCGIGDSDVVLAAASRCDELGIDTISAGGTLAFAMECGERGLLKGGPRFDEPEALLGWLDEIAFRRGLGGAMAEGSRRLAESIGGNSIAFAPQVKGLELPGYEPRSLQTLALGFAVGTRGADHNRSGAYEADFSEDVERYSGNAESGRRAIETEDRAAILDSLILCKFVRGAMEDFYGDCADLLSAVTGVHFDESDLRRIAKNIVLLRKAFNIREGWQPKDDTLPERFLSESISSGPARGARLPRKRLEEMIHGYNLARGWNRDGTLPETIVAPLFSELELLENNS